MDLMLLGYETPLTIGLFVLGLIITIMAQAKVTGSYKRLKNVKTQKGITGFEVARKILDNNDLKNIHIVETKGNLTDHYDPQRKVIRLSSAVYQTNTISAVSVAAHECGHAIQDKDGYVFMKIRSFIFPIVNFASKMAYIVLLIGFLAYITELIWLGIILVSFGVLFQLVTLPVEFNASKRAKQELEKLNILIGEENEGAKKMLLSAALTYVAGLITSLLELLRLVLIVRDK